jgi:hypothetical protein
MLLLIGAFSNSAFAEVTSLKTNDKLFYKEDQIEFSGIVEDDSTGLVTIVIRDHDEEFVLLTQAMINYDNTFEKSIKVENKFTESTTYSATGFILNMSKGITANFDVSLNGLPIKQVKESEIKKESTYAESPILEPKNIIEDNNTLTSTSKVNFVDITKNPLHYIERYYSEPDYKSWFDKNYPNMTIEEAVGYTDNTESLKSSVQNIINKEIIPEAQASSIVEPNIQNQDNSDIAQISLAIAGLGILFGAVYGVKRKVDNNSRQISINKDIIRKRIIRPIIGSNPKEIIQTRLAKGEITLEEYEKLKTELS